MLSNTPKLTLLWNVHGVRLQAWPLFFKPFKNQLKFFDSRVGLHPVGAMRNHPDISWHIAKRAVDPVQAWRLRKLLSSRARNDLNAKQWAVGWDDDVLNADGAIAPSFFGADSGACEHCPFWSLPLPIQRLSSAFAIGSSLEEVGFPEKSFFAASTAVGRNDALTWLAWNRLGWTCRDKQLTPGPEGDVLAVPAVALLAARLVSDPVANA